MSAVLLVSAVGLFLSGAWVEHHIRNRREAYERAEARDREAYLTDLRDGLTAHNSNLLEAQEEMRERLNAALGEIDILRTRLPEKAEGYREAPSKAARCITCWRRCPHCAREAADRERT